MLCRICIGQIQPRTPVLVHEDNTALPPGNMNEIIHNRYHSSLKYLDTEVRIKVISCAKCCT